MLRGDPALAATLAEEAVAGWREVGYLWGIAQALGTAAAAASERGDQVRAARLYDETLTLWLESDDGRGIAGTLAGIAGVANRRGQSERAARLLGAAWGTANPSAFATWRTMSMPSACLPPRNLNLTITCSIPRG